MSLKTAYDEIVEFIASGPSVRSVSEFRPTDDTRRRIWQLIEKEKLTGLTSEEKSELDHFGQIEHIMRLAKALATERLGSETRK